MRFRINGVEKIYSGDPGLSLLKYLRGTEHIISAKEIRKKLGILVEKDRLKVLYSILEDKKTVNEITLETGIKQEDVKKHLNVLRKERLQWGKNSSIEYVAWGGRVLIHLLSMIHKLVLEPSEYSIVGPEDLYK